MVYDFDRIRLAINEAREGSIASGPWNPPDGWWTVPSWRVFRQFSSITITITETLRESYIAASPDHPGDPFDVTETKIEKWYDFTAVIPFADFWWGENPADLPAGKSLWRHDSKTPFGEGLYDANGQFILRGTSVTRTKTTSIFTPAGGAADTDVLSDVTVTDTDATVSMEYDSDETAITGLSTFCRMTVQQALHGSGGEPGHLYPDQEEDPDGNPGAEVYWTDTALAQLAGGAWSADMVLTGSAVGEDFGTSGYWSKDYDRSGNLSLTIG
ncbi:MAG: hypothetical protein JWM59_1536 [Verrucomicrobiales bacterium]|nr:hypothetical protein [Verrucomicrobiales bacterium]